MKYLRQISCALTIFATALLAGCATPSYQTYDIQRTELKQWFASAKTLVEKERGIDLSNVTISSVSGREMLFVLSDLYGKKLDPNMTADTRIRVFADQAFEDVQTVQAVYDPFAKRIVVNQQNLKHYIGILNHRGIGARNAAMTVLIHELIHAADDKQYDLVAIEQRHKGDTLGVYMVAEGHAELETERLCVQAGCSSAFRMAQIEFHGADPHDTDQTLLTSQNNNGLLYVQSRKFLKALSERDADGSLLQQALNTPPGDVLEFFDPASFPDTARAHRRERIYQVLESVNLESNGSPILKIPKAVFDESDLPENSQQRVAYVREYKNNTLASGGMSYIEQDDQDLNSVFIELYEAPSPKAAFRIQQDFIEKRQAFTRRLRAAGIDVSHPDGYELQAMSAALPQKAQRYVIDFKRRDTGETVRLITTYMVEGRHLVVVINSDDNQKNQEALGKVLTSLRSA